MKNIPNEENHAVQARFGVLGTMLTEEIQAAYDRTCDGQLDDLDRFEAATVFETLRRVQEWAAIA